MTETGSTEREADTRRTRPAEKTTKKTAKKTAARTAKKPPARPREPTADGAEQPRKLRAARAAALAASQLRELTGRDPEAVVGMSRTDDGWRVEIEALELRRIPETTDVLACYAVELDGDGDLVSCNRLRRYVRGAAEED